MPTTTQVRRRPNVSSRRFGYTVATGVNVLMLCLINGAPGWEAVPFLTGGISRVLLLVNLSLAAGVLVNSVRVIYDPRWFVALGDIVSTSIGVGALVRIWQVFPFDFTAYSADWALVMRVVLGFAFVGSLIGILAGIVTVLRVAAGGSASDGKER